jgi:aerobic carbon-monoxide dehydrogenase large subunit
MLAPGAASVLAAREVVAKGTALAAEALEVGEADIEFADGIYTVAGTDRRIGLLELAARHAAEGGNALDTQTAMPAGRAFPSGAHVAEVEVDTETGEVALLRYVAVDDCGVVLNPTLLEGQLVGGMAQGLGQVFGELAVYDADGQLLSGSFMDYAMPRADMMGEILLEDGSVPSPNNPLGVKGAGEAGTTAALPAAMNAVLDALRPAGVDHLDMPASAGRIWQALSQAAFGS